MLRRLFAVLVLAVLAVFAYVAVTVVRHGISARQEPTRAEMLIARSLRHLAVPASLRNAKNPVPLTPAAINEGREHFADHCAQCHGNDGRGNTEMGRNLYPRAPDMTLPATQKLSDGELFAIIKNGVRLTGMPAWGGEHGDDSQTWKLVHFIRHMPRMTKEEAESMRAFNPVSRAEEKEAREERDFLGGGPPPHE
jgi:mono/diheme cytochrome c family protein